MDDQAQRSENYQIKILESGKTKGFVLCDRRVINNQQFLYYEINSMQSIKDRFGVKGMNRQQVMVLMSNLKEALEGLSEYLLGIENVVFDAGSIFFDYNTEEFRFLYCPYLREETDFGDFVDELFDLVDHEDEKAVEAVYNLSEKAHTEGCLILECLEEVLDFLGEEGIDNVRIEPVLAEIEPEIELSDMKISNEKEDKALSENVQKRGKVSGKIQFLFSGLFVLVLAAMMYIRTNYILSEEESILSVIVMLVSVISALVSFFSGIRDYQNIQEKTVANNKDVPDDKEDDLLPLYDTFETPNESSFYKKTVPVKPIAKEIPVRSEETVVLGLEDDSERPMTLYSNNLDKTERIALSDLPITIGKLEGCVDKVIRDNSISRIHCRIWQNKEGRIVLSDLNSTNGTFRNGVKLKPQEENLIEEGDEIRLGRICFDCR